MINIYNNPEKFGLKKIAELRAGGGYEYGLFVAWMKGWGDYYYGVFFDYDRGMMPFEDIGIPDLIHVTWFDEIFKAAYEWTKGEAAWATVSDKEINSFKQTLYNVLTKGK